MVTRDKIILGLIAAAFVGCINLLSRGRLFLIILGLLWWPPSALASCTTHTILNPDGSMTVCQTCCDYQGVCHTFCQ